MAKQTSLIDDDAPVGNSRKAGVEANAKVVALEKELMETMVLYAQAVGVVRLVKPLFDERSNHGITVQINSVLERWDEKCQKPLR